MYILSSMILQIDFVLNTLVTVMLTLADRMNSEFQETFVAV